MGAVLAVVLGVAALLVSPLNSGVAVASHDGPMSRRFAREVVTFGERDRSTYDIEHVRELQWRLRRVGLYRFSPNGTFGSATRTAVTRFQPRHALRPSGRAHRATWSTLLHRSNNTLRPARRRSSGDGWPACYDRRNHQVTLWRGGRLWNTWLVRGGSSDNATRTGDFTVF